MAEIINIADRSKTPRKKASEVAFDALLEFERFFCGAMEPEEGGEYLSQIGLVLIMGSDGPMGLMGRTEHFWFDTVNEVCCLPVGDKINTVTIPPLDEWGFETDGLLQEVAEYVLHGSNESEQRTITTKKPSKKVKGVRVS